MGLCYCRIGDNLHSTSSTKRTSDCCFGRIMIESEFILFNAKGKCRIKTIDKDRNEIVYELNSPNQGVYLPKMVWKEMYDFTEDSVLIE